MKNILPFILLAFSASCFGQKITPEEVLSRFSVRQSFQGKIEKEEAAYLTIVQPVGKEDSYNYSFAIGYALFPKTLNITPFFEWQRNSLSEKKQNVILSGMEAQIPILPKNIKNPTPFIIAKANYKNDQVKSTESLQGNVYATIAFNGRDGKFYPLPDAVNDFGWLSFVYNPYIGVEGEKRYAAPDENLKGATLRLYFRISAAFYPLSKALDRRLEIIPDYGYRRALSNSTSAEEDINEIFKINANIILVRRKVGTKEVVFKVGANYTKGVDPTKGFDNQELMTYTFKFKL
jgi:hypothetical protein